MSSAVAEIQQDLQKERRSRGGGGSDAAFDEAEVCLVPRGFHATWEFFLLSGYLVLIGGSEAVDRNVVALIGLYVDNTNGGAWGLFRGSW